MAALSQRIDEFVCPRCGAPTTFDPAKGALVCDHCGNGVPITVPPGTLAVYDLFGPAAREAYAQAMVVHVAREAACRHCGARTMFFRQADRCAFCDTAMVAEVETKQPGIPPAGVLPFLLDRPQACERFSAWMRKRWFAPSDLVARARNDKLDGVYVPCWIFEATSTTSYVGRRGSYDYDVNKNQPRIEWTNTSGTVRVTSSDIVVIASTSLPQALLDKLKPWHLERVCIFDERFLVGFVAERYRIEAVDSFNGAYELFKAAVDSAICGEIGGNEQLIDQRNHRWDSVRFRHVLLPIWLSAFHYKGDVFHIAVNAATGEVIGERPWSWAKIGLLVLAIFTAIFAAAGIYSHFS